MDLFGQWDPLEQSFSRALPHPNDVESLYRGSGWIPRIMNRAFETLPLFTETFHSVCPWSGTGIFWCVHPTRHSLGELLSRKALAYQFVGAIYIVIYIGDLVGKVDAGKLAHFPIVHSQQEDAALS